ncbi:hypothetical protein [Roseibium album]|uniref:hypothetical protein n=1 Tax=Roseibium album TaxID=311410 RepID=UPI0039193A50
MRGLIRLVFLSFLLSFGSISGSISQTPPHVDKTEQLVAEVVQAARTNQLSAERVLYAADQAIDAAAVIVSSVQNSRLIHSELKRLATGVPGARAIIVIGPNSKLIHV